MRHATNLAGKTFTRLTVLERDHALRARGDVFWKCVCTCGNEVVVRADKLKDGTTKSCGCWQRDYNAAQKKVRSPKKPRQRIAPEDRRLYTVWNAMRQRCNNPRDKNYKHYGGRGIAVCGEWRRFGQFKADMGYPPPGGTLERKDNNQGYSAENCLWATRKEQANNRRTGLWVGERTFAQWCDLFGVDYNRTYQRARRTSPEAVVDSLIFNNPDVACPTPFAPICSRA